MLNTVAAARIALNGNGGVFRQSVTLIVALGTTAPVLSVTVPKIEPYTACPDDGLGAKIARPRSRIRNQWNGFLIWEDVSPAVRNSTLIPHLLAS